MSSPYRGRLAPTPTGFLHLGHARTFWLAQKRARAADGELRLRIEDLDRARCKPLYTAAALEDLAWFGFQWQGDVVYQSQRQAIYLAAWVRLRDAGVIYPSPHSRRDLARALTAPHAEDDAEPLFPPALRPPPGTGSDAPAPGEVNWRFRVPDGERLAFTDGRLGARGFVAGVDFGDFLVWRRDGFPSYELAVVADDAAQGISEIVRGEDLLLSTARQLLLYRALGCDPPAFFHAPLLLDASGQRLAKRHGSLSLRQLRTRGWTPEQLRACWEGPSPALPKECPSA